MSKNPNQIEVRQSDERALQIYEHGVFLCEVKSATKAQMIARALQAHAAQESAIVQPGTLDSDLRSLSQAELIRLENAVRDEWLRRKNPLKLREVRVLAYKPTPTPADS